MDLSELRETYEPRGPREVIEGMVELIEMRLAPSWHFEHSANLAMGLTWKDCTMGGCPVHRAVVKAARRVLALEELEAKVKALREREGKHRCSNCGWGTVPPGDFCTTDRKENGDGNQSLNG
jgi:hypothetical protein